MKRAPCQHVDSTLPCNRRGREVRTGLFECSSNRLLHAEAGLAPIEVCLACPYRNLPDRDPSPAAGQAKRIRGIGDVVAGLLEAVGIKKKPGCGCAARQAWLNRLVPFSRSGK